MKKIANICISANFRSRFYCCLRKDFMWWEISCRKQETKPKPKYSNGKHIQIIVFPKPQRIYSEWDFKDTPIAFLNHHLAANSGLDWIILSDSEISAGAVLKILTKTHLNLKGAGRLFILCVNADIVASKTRQSHKQFSRNYHNYYSWVHNTIKW